MRNSILVITVGSTWETQTGQVTTENQNVSVRGFLRSLNIVLKSARMYGMSHPQTSCLLNDSWKHLQAALSEKKSGMIIGVSGNRLFVDGVAVKGGPAERGLVDLLSATDLDSVALTTEVTPSAPRFPFIAEAQVIEILSDARLKAQTSDLSSARCFLDMLNPWPAGTEIRITISHGSDMFTALGKVIFVSPNMGMVSPSQPLTAPS